MSAFIQGKGDVFGPGAAVAGNIPQFDGTTGKIIKDGKAAPAGEIVGTTDTQTLENKTLDSSIETRLTAIYRPSGVLVSSAQNVLINTVTTSNIWTYTIPAGLFAKDGDAIRLSYYNVLTGTSTGSRGSRFTLGGTVAYEILLASSVSTLHCFSTVLVQRINATNLRAVGMRSMDSASSNTSLVTVAIDVTASISAVFSLFVNSLTGSPSSQHMSSCLEFLPLI